MKLPGFPRVLVIFHPLQYPYARGLVMAYPDAELWYWRHEPLVLHQFTVFHTNPLPQDGPETGLVPNHPDLSGDPILKDAKSIIVMV